MNREELDALKVGEKIQHWAGGPIYTVTKNEGGKFVAVQKADVRCINAGKESEHFPWDVVKN